MFPFDDVTMTWTYDILNRTATCSPGEKWEDKGNMQWMNKYLKSGNAKQLFISLDDGEPIDEYDCDDDTQRDEYNPGDDKS